MAPMGHRESMANSGIGVDVLVKRVARIMTECGLVGVHPRRRWRRGKANTAGEHLMSDSKPWHVSRYRNSAR